MGSPYEPVKQAIYYIDPQLGGTINIKVNPYCRISGTHLISSQLYAKNMLRHPHSTIKLLTKNMLRNSMSRSVLATLLLHLRYLPFLFPVWVYLDWHHLWQSSAPRKLVCAKYWELLYLISGIYYHVNSYCWLAFHY